MHAPMPSDGFQISEGRSRLMAYCTGRIPALHFCDRVLACFLQLCAKSTLIQCWQAQQPFMLGARHVYGRTSPTHNRVSVDVVPWLCFAQAGFHVDFRPVPITVHPARQQQTREPYSRDLIPCSEVEPGERSASSSRLDFRCAETAQRA